MIWFAPALVALLGVVTHIRWFVTTGILIFGDWQTRTAGSTLPYLGWPVAWRPCGLGEFNWNGGPFHVLDIIAGVIFKFSDNFGLVERLAFLWPVAVLTPLAAFLLARRLVKSDLAAFVASSAYACNVGFLLLQNQHLYIMLADAFAPFAVLAYLNLAERRRPQDLLWAGLAVCAVSLSDFRIFYIIAPVLLGLVAAELVRTWRRDAWRQRLALIALGLTPFLLVLAVNADWLLGFSATASLSANPIVSRPLFGSGSLASAVTLWSGAWTWGVPEWFRSAPVPWYAWWLPVAALFGLAVARRRPYVVFFAVVTLVGIFLSKQSAPPFPNAYGWLYEHVPGFNAFREASKFRVLVALGESVLVGFGVAWLTSAGHRRSWQGRMALVAIAVLAVLPLIPTWPLMTGKIGALHSPQAVPADFAVLKSNPPPLFSRTLWAPTIPQFIDASPDRPVGAVAGLTEFLRGADLQQPSAPSVQAKSRVASFLRSPDLAAWLDRWSVSRVAVPPPTAPGDYDVYEATGTQRDDLIAALDSSAALRRVDLGLKDVIVYEHVGYRSRFSMTPGIDDLNAVEASVDVAYQRLSPSRYRLSIKGIRSPVAVSFSDSYNPGWVLAETAGFSQVAVARGWVKSIHSMPSPVGTNLFIINPERDCPRYGCVRQADGSEDYEMTAFFRPQAAFDAGAVIGLGSLFLFLSFVTGWWLWRRRT